MSKKLSYNFMRMEIQALIMKILNKANKEFKDINYKKLSAQIQYDYGVGPLTIDRIVDNLKELDMVKVKSGIIRTIVHNRPKGPNTTKWETMTFEEKKEVIKKRPNGDPTGDKG